MFITDLVRTFRNGQNATSFLKEMEFSEESEVGIYMKGSVDLESELAFIPEEESYLLEFEKGGYWYYCILSFFEFVDILEEAERGSKEYSDIELANLLISYKDYQ